MPRHDRTAQSREDNEARMARASLVVKTADYGRVISARNSHDTAINSARANPRLVSTGRDTGWCYPCAATTTIQ